MTFMDILDIYKFYLGMLPCCILAFLVDLLHMLCRHVFLVEVSLGFVPAFHLRMS